MANQLDRSIIMLSQSLFAIGGLTVVVGTLFISNEALRNTHSLANLLRKIYRATRELKCWTYKQKVQLDRSRASVTSKLKKVSAESAKLIFRGYAIFLAIMLTGWALTKLGASVRDEDFLVPILIAFFIIIVGLSRMIYAAIISCVEKLLCGLVLVFDILRSMSASVNYVFREIARRINMPEADVARIVAQIGYGLIITSAVATFIGSIQA